MRFLLAILVVDSLVTWLSRPLNLGGARASAFIKLARSADEVSN